LDLLLNPSGLRCEVVTVADVSRVRLSYARTRRGP